MSTTQSRPEITDRRDVAIKRLGGTIEWQVIEFDYGRSYILAARGSGIQFDAHFNREQFRALQAMLAHGYKDES